MRTFLIVWIGQLASMLGSEMTNFAVTIWAWSVTQQATPLSFILFFTQTPKVIAALFAGVLVDRLNRQKLMMVGDLLAGCSTIAILLLLWCDRLEIWHLYFTAAVSRLLTSFGIGGVLGAATISIWGGFKRRIHGILLGSAIWKLGLIALSITQTTSVKIGSALTCGFCSPFPDSSNQAIWMSKVKPDFQGRVFAARDLIAQIAIPLGAAIAGPLADRFFEPAMSEGGSLASIFGGLFGTQIGAGMSLAIALFSSCGLLLALGGYAFPCLREVKKRIPDYEP